jgi:hypothetical protein
MSSPPRPVGKLIVRQAAQVDRSAVLVLDDVGPIVKKPCVFETEDDGQK